MALCSSLGHADNRNGLMNVSCVSGKRGELPQRRLRSPKYLRQAIG
jgi:hypothetical protein